MKITKKITKKISKELFVKYNLNPKAVDANEWHFALNTELEHANVTKNDFDMTARIPIAHLLEHNRYYFFLKKMEAEMMVKSPKSKAEIFKVSKK